MDDPLAAASTDEPVGEGEAAVVADDTRFDARDADLLTAIDEYGSLNQAASALGRSRSRALRRVERLEGAFGELVVRRRGGAGGGGSELTDRGRTLLDQYTRLADAVAATARMRETVLSGEILTVDGELAVVRTDIGTVRGIHDGVEPGDRVQVRIASDALTVHVPSEPVDAETTSARNRCEAVLAGIASGETMHRLTMSVDGVPFRASVTDTSRRRLELAEGDSVLLTWKATATRLVQTARDR